MKYVYILNRFQLKNKCPRIADKLKKISDQFGRDYEIIINESLKDAKKLRNRFRDTEYIITAIGGDGSINHILNDLVGTKNILSFIPFGTGNDFYRSIRNETKPGIRKVDIIQINDRCFINAACFGIDADIANDEKFIHNKSIPKPLQFPASILYHFLTFKKGRRLKIECGGKVREWEFTTIVAANCQYYGGGYRISPSSKIDDGLMEVYAADSLRGLKLIRCILTMKKARHLHHPAVKRIQASRVIITSPSPFKANIDGEPLCSDRFEITLIPGGIQLEYDPQFIKEFLKK